jgi:hypothetical protein
MWCPRSKGLSARNLPVRVAATSGEEGVNSGKIDMRRGSALQVLQHVPGRFARLQNFAQGRVGKALARKSLFLQPFIGDLRQRNGPRCRI